MKKIVLACLLALPAFSQPPAGKVKVNLIDRLNSMSPEQRRKVLDRMTPEKRQALESRIDKLNNIAPEVRERVKRDYEFFQQLPPEKQESGRQVIRDIAALPLDRRPMVRGAIGNLRQQSPEAQELRMNSRPFKLRFSESERKLIRDALDTLPPPDSQATQND